MFSLSFLHERALNPTYRLSASEQVVIEMAKDAFISCDTVVVCLGGKAGRLGETIVATSLLEAMLQALRSTGKAGTPVSIIIDEGVAELFDEQLYRQAYWPQIDIIQVPSGTSQDISRIIDNSTKSNHILVLDFHGANDGMPYLQFEEEEKPCREKLRRITILGQLFRVGMRSYAVRGPHRRYADFVEDLFDLPTGSLDGLKAQPRIHLSARDEENYPRIARQWDLHSDAFHIICFFQSIVPAKCYSRWDEVMMLFCDFFAQHFLQQQVEFIIACGPDELHPAGLKQKDIAESFSSFTGTDHNARVLVCSTPSLRDLAILINHAALVFSNDTGPGHLAGALHIPTIVPYLPGNLYSKQVWASTLWHHGITLEPNPFSYQQVKAAILWDKTEIIDSIAPQALCDEALAIVRSVASAPS